jgi:hypothetical protein
MEAKENRYLLSEIVNIEMKQPDGSYKSELFVSNFKVSKYIHVNNSNILPIDFADINKLCSAGMIKSPKQKQNRFILTTPSRKAT